MARFLGAISSPWCTSHLDFLTPPAMCRVHCKNPQVVVHLQPSWRVGSIGRSRADCFVRGVDGSRFQLWQPMAAQTAMQSVKPFAEKPVGSLDISKMLFIWSYFFIFLPWISKKNHSRISTCWNWNYVCSQLPPKKIETLKSDKHSDQLRFYCFWVPAKVGHHSLHPILKGSLQSISHSR